MINDKNLTSVHIFSALLFIATAVLLLSIRNGNIPVTTENRAKRGIFNGRDTTEKLSDLIADKSGYLRIPLPDTVAESDISVSGDPYKNLISVKIRGVDTDYFRKNFFSGDMTGIEDVRYGYSDGVSTVELKTGRFTEPVTEYVQGSFFIKAACPGDIFDRVVVIDPGHGGEDTGSVVYGIEEKEINRNVALKLYDKLSAMGIKTYITVNSDEEKTGEERAVMANETGAGLLLIIHTDADPNTRTTCGISAASSPDMEEEAKELTRLISEKCSQKDLGISPSLPEVARLTDRPFISLRLGMITNKTEALKMNSTKYQEDTAEVIAQRIGYILK